MLSISLGKEGGGGQWAIQLSGPFALLRLESVLIWMCDLIAGGSLVRLSSPLPGAGGEGFTMGRGWGGGGCHQDEASSRVPATLVGRGVVSPWEV